MTERRSYKELWVVAGILLLVILVAQLPRSTRASDGGAGKARMVAVMGETRRVLISEEFRGVSMTAVMGECRLDLRKATVQPGQEVVIDVLAVMGGITIRVPDGWVVDTQAMPIMGGLKDQRVPVTDAVLFEGQRPPRIVLHGAVLMGGVHITS